MWLKTKSLKSIGRLVDESFVRLSGLQGTSGTFVIRVHWQSLISLLLSELWHLLCLKELSGCDVIKWLNCEPEKQRISLLIKRYLGQESFKSNYKLTKMLINFLTLRTVKRL